MTAVTEQFLLSRSDGELLADFLQHPQGDAFAKLVRKHGQMVLGVCRSVLRNEADAEDAAQAVFLTLARKAHSLRGQSTLVGWLHRAAWYVATCVVRAEVIRQRHEQEAARMRQEVVNEAERVPLDVLHAELNELPEKYRLPLLLHHLELRTEQETASLLGCQVSAASVRLTRGRQMLRERLLRRGVTVSAVGMGLVLANQASAGVMPGFVATAHQAAMAVVAGQAAAPSVLAAVLSKGVLHMLWLEQMKKVAMVVVVALLIGGVGVATYVIAATPAAPAAPAAPVVAAAVAPIDWPKAQAEALARKMDVSYQRNYLGEVLTDLKRRGGVRIASPGSIRRTVLVTFELQGSTVKDVLDKLAAQTHLHVEYLPGLAVVTQPAEAALAQLSPKLADRDPQVQAEAAWDLAALGDQQVAALLVKALAGKDDDTVAWIARGLSRHAQMLPLLQEAEKTALVDVLKDQIENATPLDAGPDQNQSTNETMRRLLQLLAATEHPKAQALLARWANGEGKNTALQLASLSGLAESGAPDAVAVLIDVYKKNLAIEEKEIAAKVMGATPAHRAVGYAFSALLRCSAPEAVAFVNAESAQSKYAQALMLLQNAQAENAGEEEGLAIFMPAKAIDDAKATLRQFAGKGAPAGDIWAIRSALGVMAKVNNAGAENLVVQVIKDAELMKVLACGGVGPNAVTFNAATSPSVLDALLAQVDTAGQPLQLLLVRSLGTSHAKAAADALLKLLNSADATLRAQAAQALAQTGDERAAEAIAAILRAPAAKISWPKMDPKQPGPDPRRITAGALANSRDTKALDLLLGLTQDKSIDAETRDLALRMLPEAILDDAQMTAFAAGLAKMDPAIQRSILLLSGSFISGSPALVAPCWGDARVVELIVTRAHDKEAFHFDHTGKKVNNFAVMRLSQAGNPRAAAALTKLSKDADADLAGIAMQAYKAAYAP